MRLSRHASPARLLALLALSSAYGCADTGEDGIVKPDAPNVTLGDIVCASPVTITGTKQASTEIWINGEKVVSLDESVTWMASIAINEGTNTVRVWAQSATGDKSDEKRVMTTLDLTEPGKPTVNPLGVDVVTTTTVTLSGTKPPNTAIYINGVEVYKADAGTTWTAEYRGLVPGENILRVTAHDQCQDSEVVEVEVYQDNIGCRTRFTDPPPAMSCGETFELAGPKGPDESVLLDGVEIVPANGAETWSYTLMLEEGDNPHAIRGKKGSILCMEHMFAIRYSADPPPPPTGVTVPEYTCEPALMIMGQKVRGASVLLNDVEVVPANGETSFSFMHTLMPERNLLQIDTKDSCDRTSGRPEVKEVYLDMTVPMVTVTRPTTGETLTGVIPIEGSATDNQCLAAVDVAVDGARIAMQTTTSTFSVSWDTGTVMDGPHLMSVTAIDCAGKMSAPVTRSVIVANSARNVNDDQPAATDADASRGTRPSVAVLTNGNVGIVWHDNENFLETGNDDDVFVRFYNAGTMATPTLVVSPQPNAGPRLDGRSQNARISAAAMNGAHIVWQEDGDLDNDRMNDWDILYRTYQGGALGTSYVLLSQNMANPAADGQSEYADLAVDGMGGAHVVWQDDGDLDGDGISAMDHDIYYTSGGPSGFGTPVLISEHGRDGDSVRPSIAITPDNCPHVVWSDKGQIAMNDTDMEFDVYYRGSTPNMAGGCTWGQIVLISEENAFVDALLPNIAADTMDPRGLLWVTFHGKGNVLNNSSTPMDTDVFLRNISINVMGPTVFNTGPLLLISDHMNDGVASVGPDVAVDADTNVHVVWADNGGMLGVGTDLDIFKRTFNGQLQSLEALSTNSGMINNDQPSAQPAIAAGGRTLYVTWEDRSNYDGDGVNDADILYLIR